MDIFTCIWNNDFESLKECVKNGTDVNAKDHWERNPLHIAIKYSSQKMIELLVNNGAEINAKDRFGSTPLDHAIAWNRGKEIIEFLVNNGAKKGREL